MDIERLKNWLRAYGAAWGSRDAKAASSLFAGDASYYETPFSPPARGHSGVEEYWTAATRNQSNISFSWEILDLSENVAVVRWWTKFNRKKRKSLVELDGILLLEFNDDGLCRTLREWWHTKESKTP
jgi:hypothetical protein